jgi:hypothetical protein
VNFEINIPQVVTLEFDPPTEARPGNWGDQFMYFCADNKTLWAEPEVHAQIVALEAHAGDVVAIVKRKVGRANRWEVNLVREGKMQPNAPQASPAEKPLASMPRSAPTQLSGQDRITGNLMTAALKQAIEAVEEAGLHATTEDIRALAITIYITATGGRK